MAYAASLARLEVHATTAAASLTNPIADVAIAFPAPRGRCVRLFFAGETEAELLDADSTLNSVIVGHRTTVMGFWPLSNLSELQAATTHAEAQAFVHAFRTAVLADVGLAGSCHALEVGLAVSGYAEIGGAPWATVSLDVDTEYTEYSVSR